MLISNSKYRWLLVVTAIAIGCTTTCIDARLHDPAASDLEDNDPFLISAFEEEDGEEKNNDNNEAIRQRHLGLFDWFGGYVNPTSPPSPDKNESMADEGMSDNSTDASTPVPTNETVNVYKTKVPTQVELDTSPKDMPWWYKEGKGTKVSEDEKEEKMEEEKEETKVSEEEDEMKKEKKETKESEDEKEEKTKEEKEEKFLDQEQEAETTDGPPKSHGPPKPHGPPPKKPMDPRKSPNFSLPGIPHAGSKPKPQEATSITLLHLKHNHTCTVVEHSCDAKSDKIFVCRTIQDFLSTKQVTKCIEPKLARVETDVCGCCGGDCSLQTTKKCPCPCSLDGGIVSRVIGKTPDYMKGVQMLRLDSKTGKTVSDGKEMCVPPHNQETLVQEKLAKCLDSCLPNDQLERGPEQAGSGIGVHDGE